jgi:hypothetical protein
MLRSRAEMGPAPHRSWAANAQTTTHHTAVRVGCEIKFRASGDGTDLEFCAGIARTRRTSHPHQPQPVTGIGLRCVYASIRFSARTAYRWASRVPGPAPFPAK